MEEVPGKFDSFVGSSAALFSIVVTFYALLLIYFPWIFLRFPLLGSVIFLLTWIPRLGGARCFFPRGEEAEELGSAGFPHSETGPDSNPLYAEQFADWDLRAPLEVIYEECEGGEAGEDGLLALQRRCYSESDASSEGDGEWDMQECADLIEISLDTKINDDIHEDGLIEIDLSPENMLPFNLQQ